MLLTVSIAGVAAMACIVASDPVAVHRPTATPEAVMLLDMPPDHGETLNTAWIELYALQMRLEQMRYGGNDGFRQQAMHSLAEVNQNLDCVFGKDERQNKDGISKSEQIRIAENCLNQLSTDARLARAQLKGYAQAIFSYDDITFEEANKISEALLLGSSYADMIVSIWECYSFAWGKVPYPSLPQECR